MGWYQDKQKRSNVVSGQEWRLVMGNFTEFYTRAAMDWEHFTQGMNEKLQSPEGLAPEDRWEPRCRAACVLHATTVA